MKEYIEKTITYVKGSSKTDEELYKTIFAEIKQINTDPLNKAFVCGKIADKFAKTSKKVFTKKLFNATISFIEEAETRNDPWINLNKGILNEKAERLSTAKDIYSKCLQTEVAKKEVFFKTLLKAVIERVNAKIAIHEGFVLKGAENYQKSAILFKELAEMEKSKEMKKKWKSGEIEMNELAQKYLINHSL
jgi:hypothetical protein